MHKQYFTWVTRILTRLDFGYSFAYNQPVRNLLGDRLLMTMAVSASAMLFAWIVAFPIGIISAVKQYSLFDYFSTFLGFLGMATPSFLLALVLLWVCYQVFGTNASGLFSQEFINAPWSMARVGDMLSRIWLPMIVGGFQSAAGLIRTLRANMLDELRKPYVTTAKAKGLANAFLIIKYPVRIAINPFLSSVAWMFPQLISGMSITGIVLNLPTLGPLLLNSLQNQDMYLAGSVVLILSVLTVTGTLVSDLLLAWVDPRIRYQ
jgi:peptide/nickel transport system permease protein